MMDRLGSKKWKKYLTAILSVVVLLLIASHPELRLLFPLIDALGMDVLLTLLSLQFVGLFGVYLRPSLTGIYRHAGLPLAGKAHSLLMFFSGSFGHILTVKFYAWLSRVLPGVFGHASHRCEATCPSCRNP